MKFIYTAGGNFKICHIVKADNIEDAKNEARTLTTENNKDFDYEILDEEIYEI